jgi:hypothetical protein
MNPWQLISREIAGAARSLRYDLDRRRAGTDDTVSLPVYGTRERSRQRLALSCGALLLISGGVGGYYALTDGARPAGSGSPMPAAGQEWSSDSQPTRSVELPPAPVAVQQAAAPGGSARAAVAGPAATGSPEAPPQPTPTTGPGCPAPPPGPEATAPSGTPSPSPGAESATCVTPSPSPPPSLGPPSSPSPSLSPVLSTSATPGGDVKASR